MPVGWFLAPYKRRDRGTPGQPGFRAARYCAVDDFTAQVFTDGGFWAEAEVLGSYAIVKVRASSSTLQTIAAAPGIRRLPKDRLDDPLSSLTNQQKTTLRTWIESLGYPRAEWQADLGTDLGAITLRQVLQFIRKRRLRPRYDSATDAIVCDGPVQPTTPLEAVDAAVTEG